MFWSSSEPGLQRCIEGAGWDGMAYFYYGNLMGLQWVCVRTCPNPFISGMVTWVTYGLQSLVNEGSRWSGKTRQIRELPAPLSPPALSSPPFGSVPQRPCHRPLARSQAETASEHTPGPQTPTVKREPFAAPSLRIREKSRHDGCCYLEPIIRLTS